MMENRQRGQNLVEFALILPLLLTLVLGIINFGYFFTVHTSIVHAAREGVRYGMVHPEDTTGICDRVAGQIFMTAPDLSKIKVAYEYEDDAATATELTCDDPAAATPGEIVVGDDRVSVTIEHNLPALTPLIRVSFDIDVVARRTISAQPEA
jgi:hypothetical protein